MLSRQALGFNSLVAMTSVLLGLVSVAHAGDVKTLPGSQCQQFPRSRGVWSLGWGNGTLGAAINTTPYVAPVPPALPTEPIDVVCPLPRDNTSTISGLTSLKVYGFLARSGQPLRCWVYSFKAADGSVLGFESAEQSVASRGNVVLDFGTALVNQTAADSTYALFCSVPSDGGIYSIRYEEN